MIILISKETFSNRSEICLSEHMSYFFLFYQNSVKMQSKCSQNSVKNQSKSSQNQSKCSQNSVKIQSKCSQKSVKMQPKFSQKSVSSWSAYTLKCFQSCLISSFWNLMKSLHLRLWLDEVHHFVDAPFESCRFQWCEIQAQSQVSQKKNYL